MLIQTKILNLALYILVIPSLLRELSLSSPQRILWKFLSKLLINRVYPLACTHSD